MTPENIKFRQINDEIITVLTRDGYIDQKMFISCKETQTHEKTQNEVNSENDQEPNQDQQYAKFIGISELKQTFLTNKQLISKPIPQKPKKTEDMAKNIKEIY